LILEAVVFFSVVLGCSTLPALWRRALRSHFWFALPLVWGVLAVAAWLATLLLHDPNAALAFSIAAISVTLLVRVWNWRWSWLGAHLFATVVLASMAYLVYAGLLTYASGLPLLVVALSTILLLLELAGLTLAVSYAFEIVDVLCRRDPELFRPMTQTSPWVALQVATYNEPVEIVSRTLDALAAIDYPNFIVQVVDNNTTEPALWRPLEAKCAQLGERFHFLHLENWPGYKAGALNEATRRLPSQIGVIGIVDADYIASPQFLKAMVGHFDDPSIAFVQSSQYYRDWEDSGYLRGLFFSFRYFFDVTMRSRAHRNAIIFCGTMGLIRRRALEEVGGWSETCITEDAEASLRMLGHGYRGVYDRAAYGAGMMPLDFDGLKKQRFRWALGGVQILRQWWRELLPLAPHRLRLSVAQRISYLLGALQWFGEPLTALFTLLLLATALTTALHHQLPVRQLTGAVLVIPVAFAATGLLRALWAMRLTTGCTWSDAIRALRVWFALSWVVTLACLRGLLRSNAEFLRTPKHKDEAKLWQALRSARAETLLASAALAGAAGMVLRAPGFATAMLGALLLFEGMVYASAPAAAVAAEGIPLTAERRAWRESPQNTGERPQRRGAVVGVTVALAAAGAAAIGLLVLASPSDQAPFGGSGGANLPTIGNLTQPTPASTPTPSPSASTAPSASPSASPSPAATPKPSPPAPSSTAAPSPAGTPAASPGAGG
jgi:GT2 family glycosyltransferase